MNNLKCNDALCPLNQECTSPTTLCECKKGFFPNAVGDCVDIDECSNDSHGCLRASGSISQYWTKCENTEGSYECVETTSVSDKTSATTTTMSTTTTKGYGTVLVLSSDNGWKPV